MKGPGECVKFYGSQVLHYTVPNTTGATRVSFDFRVIRREEWTCSAFKSFPLGEHYLVLDAQQGVLAPDSEEMQQLICKFAE